MKNEIKELLENIEALHKEITRIQAEVKAVEAVEQWKGYSNVTQKPVEVWTVDIPGLIIQFKQAIFQEKRAALRQHTHDLKIAVKKLNNILNG